ncbi:dienelactone hydrolase family protein [Spirochaeta cellobiosiphila]|uniref:dienelactone hydrolase family protein n=1 Tax=Spirochaeta cellobiosiphila TaxID=504483 RepID=UPI000429D8EF|nr:dienelactone hydrolase family protein [Spirochaeta cellobiosiphila]
MNVNKFITTGFLLLLSGLIFGQNIENKKGKEVMVKEITYHVDGQRLVAYLAYEDNNTKKPGVIVVHEWTGLNDYAKKRARDLATEGYIALAIDMYGDGKEIDVSKARQMSSKVGSDFDLIKKRFNAGLDVLKSQPNVDTSRLGAIGYCFGGGIVLNMARMGVDLKGIVSFHGTINTGLNAKPGDIKTKLLVIQGQGDPVTPPERQEAFKQEMSNAKADYKYIIYPGVNAHNFTNPSGQTFYPEEASQAWKEMLVFFKENL